MCGIICGYYQMIPEVLCPVALDVIAIDAGGGIVDPLALFHRPITPGADYGDINPFRRHLLHPLLFRNPHPLLGHHRPLRAARREVLLASAQRSEIPGSGDSDLGTSTWSPSGSIKSFWGSTLSRRSSMPSGFPSSLVNRILGRQVWSNRHRRRWPGTPF